MSVYIAAPISILKFIRFEQYPLNQVLSTEAIDCSSDSVAKWLIYTPYLSNRHSKAFKL